MKKAVEYDMNIMAVHHLKDYWMCSLVVLC